jgi:hypothetical protein
VDRAGYPIGAIGAIRQLSSELAHAPSWTGDSKRILYLATDLSILKTRSGTLRRGSIQIDALPVAELPSGAPCATDVQRIRRERRDVAAENLVG